MQTVSPSSETHSLPESPGSDPKLAPGSLAPLEGPSAEVPESAAAKADGSPSAVASAEAALIYAHTKILDRLPGLEKDAADSKAELAKAKADLKDIVRLLAAHKRLKEPRRRAPK